MQGTITETRRAGDAEKEIFGSTWEGQGHLEKCMVSSRVSRSLPGGLAERRLCAWVQKHEATWPCAPWSDSENTANSVQTYLSPLMHP